MKFKTIGPWLQDFPADWITTVSTPTGHRVHILKYAPVCLQRYSLAGRDTFDEEYIFISPSGSILDEKPFYSSAKFPAILSNLIQHYGTINKALNAADNWSVVGPKTDTINIFNAARPNYGHCLLDYGPCIQASILLSRLLDKRVILHSGSSSHSYTTELQHILASYYSNKVHFKASTQTSPISVYSNVGIIELLPRDVQIRAYKPFLIDAIRHNREYIEPHKSPNLSSRFLFAHRTIRPRVDLPIEFRCNLQKYRSLVDFTELSICDAYAAVSRLRFFVVPFGAETSNLIFFQGEQCHVLTSSEGVQNSSYIYALADTVLPLNESIVIKSLSSKTCQSNTTGLADATLIAIEEDLRKYESWIC